MKNLKGSINTQICKKLYDPLWEGLSSRHKIGRELDNYLYGRIRNHVITRIRTQLDNPLYTQLKINTL